MSVVDEVYLIEPINVTVKQIDKVQTTYSTGVTGRREPINNIVRGVEFDLQAQVVFIGGDTKINYTQLGASEHSKGYLVLRYADVNNKGIELKNGDKIIKMGQLNTNYFFEHSQGDPAAHFQSIGGFTLFRMFFTDREPKG